MMVDRFPETFGYGLRNDVQVRLQSFYHSMHYFEHLLVRFLLFAEL